MLVDAAGSGSISVWAASLSTGMCCWGLGCCSVTRIFGLRSCSCPIMLKLRIIGSLTTGGICSRPCPTR